MTDLTIHVDRQDDQPPPLRIVRGPLGLLSNDDTCVRPCEHPRFILDDEWKTVTCGECRQLVDAYSALRMYAKWYQRIRREHEDTQHAEWALLAADVRKMLKRRQFTDEERTSIGRESHTFGKDSLETIRKVHAEISKRVSESKSEGRRRRG